MTDELRRVNETAERRRAAILAGQADWPKDQWDAEFARIAARGPESRSSFPPDDHARYLRWPLWRRISRRLMRRDGGLCVRCGAAAAAGHRRRYTPEVLAGEDDSQRVAI